VATAPNLLLSDVLVPVLAQTDESTFPEDTGARVLFVVVGVAIVALYLLLRRTRRRTEDAYWERRRREKGLRDADPDMRRDET
jgi:hypothetical protein